MRKELPFKHIEEPKKFARQGTVSDVFAFKPEKDKNYFYKEIPDRSLQFYPGKTLEEKTASMKVVYEALKDYYGDRIADTYFIVGKNKEDKPSIMKIQEEIEGDRLDELKRTDNPKFNKLWQQMVKMYEDIPRVTDKIMENPRFVDFKKEHPKYEKRHTKALISDLRA